MASKMYTNGEYIKFHPSLHIEHSPWKAKQIFRMLEKNNLSPKTVCEIGCGAGEILNQLQKHLDTSVKFLGYEISPQAHEIAKEKTNPNLQFKLGDFLQEKNTYFDLILLIDLLEHLENPFLFLRKIKPSSAYKIIHFPLDLSARTVLRGTSLINVRHLYGHIHYFTKEIALELLKETGYEIIDHFYTEVMLDFPTMLKRDYILKFLIRLFSIINIDFGNRLLGGRALLVLVK